MENLRKALDKRLEKARYTKRTGSPGHYKYEYRESKGSKRVGYRQHGGDRGKLMSDSDVKKELRDKRRSNKNKTSDENKSKNLQLQQNNGPNKNIKLPNHIDKMLSSLPPQKTSFRNDVKKAAAHGMKFPSTKEMVQQEKENVAGIFSDDHKYAKETIEEGITKEYNNLHSLEKKINYLGLRNEQDNLWNKKNVDAYAQERLSDMAEDYTNDMDPMDIVDKYYNVPKKDMAMMQLDLLVSTYLDKNNID